MKSNQRIAKMHINDARRMFDAGNTDRLTASWSAIDYTADQVLYSQLPTLRARARQQSRNNDYVVRFIQLLQNNVLGAQGFKLRSQILDNQGNADKPARDVVECGWAIFAENVGLTEIEHQMMASFVTDGEAFLFLRVTASGELRPELIDPVRIDTNFNRSEQGKNLIVMGIEYDPEDNTTPIAYHVNDGYSGYHPSVGDTGAVARTRIPATRMRHLFRKFYVGQRRGFPWIAASLNRLFQLGRFEDAALMAARIGAAKMGFFYNEHNDEYTGDESNGSEMSINAEAGTFENIGSMRFAEFNPTYPSGEFKVFHDKMLQGISSGWGVDHHTVSNDLSGVNYSSARVGMLETREFYKTLQTWLISNFVRPLFEVWLEIELFAGRLTIGKNALSRGFAYYRPAHFVGRRWDWVDPQKEAIAKRTLYDMRVISLSQIIRERGDDPEDVFREIAEENKLLASLGLTPPDVMAKVAPIDEESEEKGKKANGSTTTKD